jgi:hypothetical protein
MFNSDQINELTSALAKAHGEFKEPELDAVNPFFKSRYATLGSVLRAVRPSLSKHGLAVLQFVNDSKLETVITHSSGQSISSLYPIHSGKNDAQGFGAAVSYARRYSLKAILSLAEEDNDCNESSSPAPYVDAPIKSPAAIRFSTPTEAQIKRLHAIASASQWASHDVKSFMKTSYNIESSKDLTREQYDEMCSYLQKNKPNMGDLPK